MVATAKAKGHSHNAFQLQGLQRCIIGMLSMLQPTYARLLNAILYDLKPRKLSSRFSCRQALPALHLVLTSHQGCFLAITLAMRTLASKAVASRLLNLGDRKSCLCALHKVTSRPALPASTHPMATLEVLPARIAPRALSLALQRWLA